MYENDKTHENDTRMVMLHFLLVIILSLMPSALGGNSSRMSGTYRSQTMFLNHVRYREYRDTGMKANTRILRIQGYIDNMHGYREYKDIENVRIQRYREYMDTENTWIQRIEGYREYRGTGIQSIQGYRDTEIQRIHGYRQYRGTWDTEYTETTGIQWACTIVAAPFIG